MYQLSPYMNKKKVVPKKVVWEGGGVNTPSHIWKLFIVCLSFLLFSLSPLTIYCNYPLPGKATNLPLFLNPSVVLVLPCWTKSLPLSFCLFRDIYTSMILKKKTKMILSSIINRYFLLDIKTWYIFTPNLSIIKSTLEL